MGNIGWLGLLSAAFIMIPSLGFGAQGEVRKLEFNPGKEKTTLTVFFQGKGAFRVFQSETQGSVVLEAGNLVLPARLTKLMDSAGTGSPVVQVTPYASGDAKRPVSKFVLQLKEEVELVSSEVPGKFSLELKPKKISKGLPKKKAVPTLSRGGWSESDSIKNRKSAAEKGEEVAKRLMEVLNSAPDEKTYFGSRITFEGSQVDVHDIFRLIGEKSGLNIMTDSDVDYKADFSVADIPWDQFLEIVLDQAQLKAKALGNVIRIISGERFAKEQEAKLREIDIADENEPVVIAIVPLSFATAEDMKSMVEALLVKRDSTYDSKQNDPKDPQNYVLSTSGATSTAGTTGGSSQALTSVAARAKKIKLAQDFVRGKIEVDSRSNSLVVTNTKRAIERIRKLVKELDVALPQILIDTKIIIASETFSRSLGVNWGGRATSGGSGRAGVGGVFNGRTVTLGDSEDAAAFTVSSGTSAGALGFQIGAGRHGNLSAQLNLAEINGISKTVASPRIIVNNKQAATVTDGQTIYLANAAGANTSGAFTQVSASLSLSVIPQVTSVGSVLLQVSIQKDAPSAVAVNGQTTIETKQISTQVLVDSGNTLVLGGVYQNVKTKGEDGIPMLMNLPFIGSLFRTNSESDTKSELMVFLTPEIVDVKGAVEASAL